MPYTCNTCHTEHETGEVCTKPMDKPPLNIQKALAVLNRRMDYLKQKGILQSESTTRIRLSDLREVIYALSDVPLLKEVDQFGDTKQTGIPVNEPEKEPEKKSQNEAPWFCEKCEKILTKKELKNSHSIKVMRIKEIIRKVYELKYPVFSNDKENIAVLHAFITLINELDREIE